ncbi:MAG TPA: ACP S-malonyltransferase [Thermoanaerobaculia bacterium]|jgi:[acyl-carrier-protein] S-malonyltransferase|nr:ACP S-malonyltransferase [Thermoanaerobaculia bacterium]
MTSDAVFGAPGGVLARTHAFVFPGQGAQKVGMGRAWADVSAAAREAFAEADEALGCPLSKLCWEGPEEELNLTANTQPALLATSIAIHRALLETGTPFAPVAFAGHSLGEWSAQVAAGALDFGDALRLVRRRGELMQEAVPVGMGGMAAIIGMDLATIAGIAADAVADHPQEICAVANLNGPGQTVLAGHRTAIDRAVELAKARGARKATILVVSAPFHSPLMKPAREGMAELLAVTEVRDPVVPVISNVDAAPVTTGAAARDALIRQIDHGVRWAESVRYMAETLGVGLFIEVGPGTVLSGLNRRIVEGVRVASTGEPAQFEKLLAMAAEEM